MKHCADTQMPSEMFYPVMCDKYFSKMTPGT